GGKQWGTSLASVVPRFRAPEPQGGRYRFVGVIPLPLMPGQGFCHGRNRQRCTTTSAPRPTLEQLGAQLLPPLINPQRTPVPDSTCQKKKKNSPSCPKPKVGLAARVRLLDSFTLGQGLEPSSALACSLRKTSRRCWPAVLWGFAVRSFCNTSSVAANSRRVR